MNEEEKEAMKYLTEYAYATYDYVLKAKDAKIILNLIEKQQAEIEQLKSDFEIVDHECSRLEQEDIKKDKIINLIAGYIAKYYKNDDDINNFAKEVMKRGEWTNLKSILIEYFERKIEQ